MVDALAYIAGVFAMLSFFPQIWKALKTRSTQDLSWGMLAITQASVVLYEIYAIILGLTPVIITNAVFIASVFFTMALKWRYDRANAASAGI